MKTKKARNISLLFVALATMSATPGCVSGPSTDGDVIVDVDELRSLAVEIDRDGSADHYPRTITIWITLPWPDAGCAILAPSIAFTLNGRAPMHGIARGGVSPYPGFFGDVVCENFASATFRVPDEGGALVVRIAQDGHQPAEIEFDVPALEPLELVAPADGRLRPGDVATVRVPSSFYTTRHLDRPTPQPIGSSVIGNNPAPFDLAILIERGGDLADYGAERVIGGVGVGTDDLHVQVPTYTSIGPKSVYVAYNFSPNFEPMPVRRCDGFAQCTGKARDNFGVLGPIDVVVE